MFTMSSHYIKKSDAFSAVKEANIIEDKMKNLSPDSKDYQDLSEALNYVLDVFIGVKNCSLHYSKRTGHYYVRF